MCLIRATIVVLLMALAGCAGGGKTAEMGRKEAFKDARRGHYEIRTYGMPSPDQDLYVEHLQTQYGIRFRRVAGCMVPGGLVRHTDAYNEVMREKIQERFGRDVLNDRPGHSELDSGSRDIGN